MEFHTYFSPHSYVVRNETSINLNEVTDGDSFTVELYNAQNAVTTAPVVFDLPDSTFDITWPGQTALSTKAELEANPLTILAYNRVTVTVTFREAKQDSSDSGLTFSWSDASIPVEFTRYYLVTEKPQRDMVEVIEFKTDVAEAWDGTEKRTRVRANPRSTVKQDFLVSGDGRQAGISLQAKMMALPGRNAKVVAWHREQAVASSTVTVDGRTLTVSGTLEPELAALDTGDRVWYVIPSTGDIGSGVASRASTATTLFLDPSIGYDYPTNVNAGDVALLPTTPSYMREKPSVKLFPSGATSYSTEWLTPNLETPSGNALDSSTSWEGLCGSESYESRPVLREGQYIQDSLKFASDSGSVWFDQKIGTVSTFNRRESSAVTFERRFEYTYEDGRVSDLRNFIHWTWGRQRSFWVPSGADDLLILSAAADGSSATFYGDDMGLLAPLLDGYSHLEADFGNGTRKRAQVTAQDSDGTNVTLTFGVNPFVTSEDLSSFPNMTVSFLYHVRLGSDKVKIQYDGTEAVSCRINVVTVKQ